MAHAQATTSSRSRRPARASIHWQRVSRWALLGTLAVIVLLYVQPLSHWIEQRGTQAREQAAVRQLQSEHDRLQSRLDALGSPGGIARAARALGMVRSGERPYQILPSGR